VERFECAQESLLDHVLGPISATHAAASHAMQRRLVAPHQGRKLILVPGQNGGDEGPI
jgi:hypothetical protein